MTTTTIKFEEPYYCEAVVEKPDGMPPYLQAVNKVTVSWEGKKLDVTLLVMANSELCRKLEDRVMRLYQELV